MKAAEFKDYILITAANRKNAITKGRVVYCIELNGTLIQYNGSFHIRPQLTRGRIKVIGHPFLPATDTFIPSDEDFNDYRIGFDTLITHLINKKHLYFKISDPIIKYEKQEIKK